MSKVNLKWVILGIFPFLLIALGFAAIKYKEHRMIIAGNIPVKNLFDVPPPAAPRDPLNWEKVPFSNGELLSDKLVNEFGADRSTLYKIDGAEHYFSDRKHIFLIFPKIHIVEGADASTFEIIDGWSGAIARDKNFIYARGVVQPQLDRDTFEHVEGEGPRHGNGSYFKDKHHLYDSAPVNSPGVYLLNFKIIDGVDPLDFKILGFNGSLISSKDFLYWNGDKIDGILAPNARVLRATYQGGYIVSDAGTYYLEHIFNTPQSPERADLRLISTSSDPVFFSSDCRGSACYLRVGNQINYGTSTVLGVNLQMFSVPCVKECSLMKSDAYAVDGHALYYEGRKVPGSTGVGFRFIGGPLILDYGDTHGQSNYVTDSAGVYYDGIPVVGAHRGGFDVIETGSFAQEYAKDGTNIYFQEKIIDGADVETFMPYPGQQSPKGCSAGNYSRDNRAVYFKDKIVPGAKPETFKPMAGGDYGQDGEQYYKGTEKVKKGDVERPEMCGG